MSICLEAALLSGKRTRILADRDDPVKKLRCEVCAALGVDRGSLIGPSGNSLSGIATVGEEGLQSGDVLTVHISEPRVAASVPAFATILQDRTVEISAEIEDSTAPTQTLEKVRAIRSCVDAFAAISDDGCVVTWGSPASGGDSSAVQAQLRNVRQIQATAPTTSADIPGSGEGGGA